MEQNKSHRTDSKTAKTIKLFSAIASVAVSAKDSQLCDQFFVDHKAELNRTGSYQLTKDLPLKEIRKLHLSMIDDRREIEELKKKIEATDDLN